MWYVEIMYASDQWWNELRIPAPDEGYTRPHLYATYEEAQAAAVTYRLLNPAIKATRIVETK